MGILEDIFGMAQGPDQMQKRRLFGALNRLQADDTPGAIIQRSLGGMAPMPQQSAPGAAPMPTPATASPGGPPPMPAPSNSPSATTQSGGSGYTVDRLGAFSDGYSKGGLIGAIANATGGANRQEGAVNETYQFLVRKGLPEADARAVVQNPQLMQQVLPRLIGPKSQGELIEYFDEQTGQPRKGLMGADGSIQPIGGVRASERKQEFTNGAPAGTMWIDPNDQSKGVRTIPGYDPQAKAENAPSGYRWAEGGKSLEPIPGGPTEKLSSETAAKIGMMNAARQTLPRLRKIMTEDAKDRNSVSEIAGYYGQVGDVGEATRLITGAIEGILRAASGAAVPEVEVKRYTSLFGPTPFDTIQTRTRKLDSLERWVSSIETSVKAGRPMSSEEAAALAEGMARGLNDPLNSEPNNAGGSGVVTTTPPPEQTQAAAPAPLYREVVVPQGTNPRAPGYRAGAGAPQAPNNFNPRAPGYKPPERTLDAGDGFKVRVK